MSQHQHDKDLYGRFSGVDYVSEFQKYWAMFNKWFKSETRKDRDRGAIQSLKSNQRIIDALKDNLTNVPLDPLLEKILPQAAKDYYKYAHESLASSFVKACWDDCSIKNRLNLFDRFEGIKMCYKPKATATVHITLEQYRAIHSRAQDILAEPPYMSVSDEEAAIETILNSEGIGYTGSCFYRDSFPKPARLQQSYCRECWARIEKDPKLGILSELEASPEKPGLYSDLIEMLYLVRNAAVHGDLDFLDEKNNKTAKTGLALLNGLIKNILRPGKHTI